MKVIICPDSFKGTCNAPAAAAAIARGVRAVFPAAQIILLPLADGGEGTLATLCPDPAQRRSEHVHDPLLRSITAAWGCMSDDTAIVEMAAASGLTLLTPAERNPLRTTTFGTGELIRAALRTGCGRLIIGLGGSATNDAGAGMAQALGYRFFDRNGHLLPDGLSGGGLEQVAAIDACYVLPELHACIVSAACDVRNPLCGPQGASAVFAPQKGATPDDVARLDAALAAFADVIERDCGVAVRELPGAGAAGGLGAGCVAFLHAQLVPGIDLVLDVLRFEEHLQGATLVITGEGRLDAQSLMGKAVSGVVRRASCAGVPVIALAGSVDEQGALPCPAYGIVNHGVPLAEACAHTEQHLAQLAAHVMRQLPHDMTRG